MYEFTKCQYNIYMQTKNKLIIQKAMIKAAVKNKSKLAVFLTEKYGVKITRQQINQFEKSNALTITNLLLKELAE